MGPEWCTGNTNEIGVQIPSQAQVEELPVACLWLGVHSTDLNKLYVLVPSAVPTTCPNKTNAKVPGAT